MNKPINIKTQNEANESIPKEPGILETIRSEKATFLVFDNLIFLLKIIF